MLQRLIHSARVNVFESARFYYWVLWILIGYSIVREVVQKFTLVYFIEPFIFPREIVGVLFFVFALCSIISAWVLRREIDKVFYTLIGTIVAISLVNELRSASRMTDYNLIESLTRGQIYYAARTVFPFLFLGVWEVLDKGKLQTKKVVFFIEKLMLLNAVLVLFGGIIAQNSLFQSYVFSERWGYSGMFFHRIETQLIYGLLLIYSFHQNKSFNFKSIIFALMLVVSGQKAGFLWLFLFIFFTYLDTPFKKLLGYISVGVLVGFSERLLSNLVYFNSFFERVYNEHGFWWGIFSGRNKAVENLYVNDLQNIHLLDWAIGGINRFPNDVEILPVDIFIYFGLLGLGVCVWFFRNWLPSIKWYIPLIVACLAGDLFGYPLMILFYGFFVTLNRSRA